jgi:hypothetical protein
VYLKLAVAVNGTLSVAVIANGISDKATGNAFLNTTSNLPL